MKKIVLVALLAAAAGCSKKGPDCDAEIGKGIEAYTAAVKAKAPNPQMAENMVMVVGKLKEALTERCKADKWPAEVVTCFSGVNNMQSMQACQSKLSEEQRNKLVSQLREAMMSARGAMGGRMPGGMAGHPSMLGGSAAGAGAPAGGPAADGSGAMAPAGSAAAPAAGGAAAPAAPTPPPGSPAPAAGAAPAAGGW